MIGLSCFKCVSKGSRPVGLLFILAIILFTMAGLLLIIFTIMRHGSNENDMFSPVFELVQELVDLKLHTKPRQNPLIKRVAKASRVPTNQNARIFYLGF